MGALKRKSSSNSKTLAKSKKMKGPYLPNSILKLIATQKRLFNSDAIFDSDHENGVDLYEYEEGIAEEESRKNNRYGRLDSYEFKLPDDFEDEDLESEDDVNSENDDDEDRHTRMLQALTGMPSAAFDSESKRKYVLFTEAYPEGEFNPTRDALEGKNILTEEDFLAPLKGKPGHHKTSRQISRMRKDTNSVVHPPLPKPEREKLERKAVKGLVDEEFSKWVHLVKKNREAPTLYLNHAVNLGNSTVAAIASEFQPRTEFEMRMASVLNDNEISEAHREDGARLLELNKVSMEGHVKDHDHVAKMRVLLFRHERRNKQQKKNKFKPNRRLKNRDLRNSAIRALMDPEMAKEEAVKQEFKRVAERFTFRHKNRGKFAKHMLSLGLNVKNDGIREAIDEQLQLNAVLSRKMNSMRDGSSSDESGDDDDEELNDGSDEDTLYKLVAKAKEKILKTLEDDEVPNSGLMSLPFMARAMKKKEEANEEAKRALEEYEAWENSGGPVNPKKAVTVSGRRVFGATAKVEASEESKKDSDNFYDNTDSDNDKDGELEDVRDVASPARRNTGTTIHEGSEDSESEGEEMVDGILTSVSKETFEFPSQAEIINRAFAGDDVVDEFEKDKQEVLNQEVPEPEKPVRLPGWGQWTTNRRGYYHNKPTMKDEEAKKQREKILKTRRDARLKHVIISEKVDKKAEKLHTSTIPFPYASKEVFEQSMRMPIGPEFNPSTAVEDLNRPEVVKKTGAIIKPVKFEEVNPNEEVDDEHPRNHQKPRLKKKTGRHQTKAK